MQANNGDWRNQVLRSQDFRVLERIQSRFDRYEEYPETNLLTYKNEEHADATENTELSVDEVKELVEAVEPLERIAEVEPVLEITTDLLGIEEIRSIASEIDQKNALALSIIQPEEELRTSTPTDLLSSGSGWELALVSTPSNNISNFVESKLAGGFDKLLLDSLYDDASRRQQITGDNSVGCLNVNSFEPSNPFIMPSGLSPPTNVQMNLMAQQQQKQYYYQQQQQLYYQQQQMSQHYQQQQQQMMMMVPYGYQTQNHHLQAGQTNPFSVPFTEYSQNAPSQGNSSLI